MAFSSTSGRLGVASPGGGAKPGHGQGRSARPARTGTRLVLLSWPGPWRCRRHTRAPPSNWQRPLKRNAITWTDWLLKWLKLDSCAMVGRVGEIYTPDKNRILVKHCYCSQHLPTMLREHLSKLFLLIGRWFEAVLESRVHLYFGYPLFAGSWSTLYTKDFYIHVNRHLVPTKSLLSSYWSKALQSDS